MLAIALPKGGDQFRVLLTSLGMEPLLELVQDQQHLPLRRQDATPSQVRQRIDQPRSSGQFRTRLAQALEQPGFGLLRGRLDVDRKDVLAQPGQKSRLDQRATCRIPRDRRSAPPGRSGRGRSARSSLPEPDAVGQTVPVPWSGQQFQEEVGIMLVEGSQPFRDDLDRSLVGVGLPGGDRRWSGFLGRSGWGD